MTWLRCADAALFKLVSLLAQLFLLAAVLVGFWQVVTRFMLESPADWSEITTRALLIWAVLLGVALAFRHGAMLGVDFLRTLLAAPAQYPGFAQRLRQWHRGAPAKRCLGHALLRQVLSRRGARRRQQYGLLQRPAVVPHWRSGQLRFGGGQWQSERLCGWVGNSCPLKPPPRGNRQICRIPPSLQDDAMLGMNAHTGQPLAGLDHLRQSIADILSTPLNTRVMRRDYGSRLPELIDQPITPRLAVELYAATAEALRRWEPRFKLTRVRLTDARAGWVQITLEGEVRLQGFEGQTVTLSGLSIGNGGRP